MLKSLVSLLGVCVFAAACGSSSSSSTPAAPSSSGGATTTTTTTTTAPSTSTSGVFTFNFDAGMQVSDQDLIKNAVTNAAAFYQSAVGRGVTQATTISVSATAAGCADPGSAAFTGIRTLTICGKNNGWLAHNTLNRTKIVMHETFHLVQFEMRWLGTANPDATSAHWIDEGSAEFMGWQGVANQGLISFSAARSCMAAQAAPAPASQTLSGMETGAGFGGAGAGVPYQLSMMGMDQLVTPKGLPSLVTYGNAVSTGTSWPTAFQNAWGTSTTSFYAGFPAYRSGLSASDTCGV